MVQDPCSAVYPIANLTRLRYDGHAMPRRTHLLTVAFGLCMLGAGCAGSWRHQSCGSEEVICTRLIRDLHKVNRRSPIGDIVVGTVGDPEVRKFRDGEFLPFKRFVEQYVHYHDMVEVRGGEPGVDIEVKLGIVRESTPDDAPELRYEFKVGGVTHKACFAIHGAEINDYDHIYDLSLYETNDRAIARARIREPNVAIWVELEPDGRAKADEWALIYNPTGNDNQRFNSLEWSDWFGAKTRQEYIQVIVPSWPEPADVTPEQIEQLVEYVRSGGLLMLSGYGHWALFDQVYQAGMALEFPRQTRQRARESVQSIDARVIPVALRDMDDIRLEGLRDGSGEIRARITKRPLHIRGVTSLNLLDEAFCDNYEFVSCSVNLAYDTGEGRQRETVRKPGVVEAQIGKGWVLYLAIPMGTVSDPEYDILRDHLHGPGNNMIREHQLADLLPQLLRFQAEEKACEGSERTSTRAGQAGGARR